LRYNEALDVWSAGCVVAEVLGSTGAKICPLFPGPSFPSVHYSSCKIGAIDQSGTIFSIMGTPPEAEIMQIHDQDIQGNLRKFESRMSPQVFWQQCRGKFGPKDAAVLA